MNMMIYDDSRTLPIKIINSRNYMAHAMRKSMLLDCIDNLYDWKSNGKSMLQNYIDNSQD